MLCHCRQNEKQARHLSTFKVLYHHYNLSSQRYQVRYCIVCVSSTMMATTAAAAAAAPNGSLKKDIRLAFTQAGLGNIDKDILKKCVALASTLQMTPEAMATCWEAFSLTKKVSELTSHTFEAYKTQVYKHSENAPPSVVTSSNSSDHGGAIQSRNVKRQASTVTPPSAKRQQQTPPKNSKGAAGSSSVDSVALNTSESPSPAAASRPKTPGPPLPKYEERTKVGQVAASFNPKEWPAIAAPTTTGAGKQRCVIEAKDLFGNAATTITTSNNITEPYRHMFTAISERAQALEEHLQSMGQQIIDKYGISDGENGIAPLEQVNIPRQETVCCVGRICNEAHEGKLNSTSVVLEGSSATCGGARINVDLSHLKSTKQAYSLFPGQIVAVEGMNPTGRKLVAHRICEGAAHTANTSSIGELRAFHHDKQEGKPLKVFTASGPFTTSDSMSYQPFVDFLHVVMEQSPDVVILTGPFVDMRQEAIQSGKTTIELEDDAGNLVEQSVPYEAVFANKISSVIEEAFLVDEKLATKFVLVPSLDDATAKWVYPQPPLQDRLSRPVALDVPGAVELGTMGIGRINEDQKATRVHCLSNPCTFKINEVVFGVTSTDVLFQISAEETNSNLEPGSRLRRIAQHMLQQRSFYPLFPAPSAFPTNLDLKHMENWQMPCLPDVLVAPSRLTCFATSILDSTVFVNPGHLTRGTTGGTYGMMEIHPIKRETLDESGGDDVRLQHGVPDRIAVEIKRI